MSRGTTQPPAYSSTLELEGALGDPFDADNPLSLRQFMAWDEREEYPTAGVARLRQHGFQAYFIPHSLGGRLTSFEETFSLVRAVSRRDMVMVMGFGSSLVGSIPVWMWGSADQRRAVAETLRAGEFAAMAFSEDRAGNDVLATETVAEPDGDGFRLTGEKWLIGNATTGACMSVLARSGQDVSFFLVHKRDLDPACFRHLPKIRTLGLRGHDVSGVAFDGCRIASGSVIGEAGRGVEMMLRTVQITKTLTAAMSLGLVDTALRIAVRYARERRLYGREIAALAPIKELLVGAFVDTLACDCVATSTARALTAAPERISLWSAVTKYMVPVTCERVVRDLSVVLSARFYLREKVAEGMFQKIGRDLAITSIFEGTTLLQLMFIGSQLEAVTRPGGRSGREAVGLDLRGLFHLGQAAPAWNIDDPRLLVSNAGQDEILQRFEPAARAFQGAYPTAGGDPAALEAIAGLLGRLVEQRRLLVERVAATPPAARAGRLARAHCALHAAAACFHTWIYNRDLLGGEFADGRWLAIALARQLRELVGPQAEEAPAAFVDDVFAWMQRLADEGRMFSVAGLPLGGG